MISGSWNRLIDFGGLGPLGSGHGGRLCQYDALGRRIHEWDIAARSGWTQLIYSAAGQVLSEHAVSTSTGQPASAAKAREVWGLGYVNALVLRDRDVTGSGVMTERLYAQQDANWNVTAVVGVGYGTATTWSWGWGYGPGYDPYGGSGYGYGYGETTTTFARGAVAERYAYGAYGDVVYLNPDNTAYTTQTSAYGWIYGFQGGRYDPRNGLYLFGARTYDPNLGRWMERDPEGVGVDGMNTYAFVDDTPIDGRDPSGNITVRTVSQQVSVTGAFTVRWNFILDKPAPKGGGYIVQKVTSSRTPSRTNPPPPNTGGFGPRNVPEVVY